MKLSAFVFAAATVTAVDALNLRKVGRSLQNDTIGAMHHGEAHEELEVAHHGEAHEEEVDAAHHGGEHLDLEVKCKEQVSVMKVMINSVGEGAISLMMESASERLSPFVNDDTCQIMGCNEARRLQLSLTMIMPIVMKLVAKILPLVMQQIQSFSVDTFGIDLDSIVQSYAGVTLTEAVNSFSESLTDEIETAEAEAAPEIASEELTVVAAKNDEGTVIAAKTDDAAVIAAKNDEAAVVIKAEEVAVAEVVKEGGDARKLQVADRIKQFQEQSMSDIVINILSNEMVMNILKQLGAKLLDYATGLVSLGEVAIENAPQAFAMVDEDASNMIKDLLDEVNANELLEIIQGSIDEAKETDITAFSMAAVSAIEPCATTVVYEAEAEAESLFSVAVAEFCTSFCEN